MPRFAWDQRRVRAAEMVAEGKWSDPKIAAEVGVTDRTVFNWRCHPEFKARVRQIIEAFADASLDMAIAQKARRVASLNEQWLAMHEVIRQRAADPGLQSVPGGNTGLLKLLPSGGAIFDDRLLKSMLEHGRQAAEELGQRIEKGEYDLSDAELLSRTEAVKAADAEARPASAPKRPDPRG
jgi:hypothetical protein